MDWMSKKHEDYWQSIQGQRQAKGFLKTPSTKKGGELFNLKQKPAKNTDSAPNRALPFKRT